MTPYGYMVVGTIIAFIGALTAPAIGFSAFIWLHWQLRDGVYMDVGTQWGEL